MRWVGRALVCLNGVDLSERMSQFLTEFCDQPPDRAADRTTKVHWGGTWFCPADGARMASSRHQLPCCPECGRVLPGGRVYELVEFNHHPKFGARADGVPNRILNEVNTAERWGRRPGGRP